VSDAKRGPAPPRPAGLRDLVAALALLALAVAFVSFGNWQWRRAAESRATAESFAAAAAAEPLTELPSEPLEDAVRFRRLVATGHFVADRQVLLDNIVHDEAVGYDVLTPFAPAGGGPWLLVNRGWVAAPPDRSVLPSVTVDAAERTLVGRLERLPRPGLRLGAGAPVTASSWPVVLSYPTAATLAELLEKPVHDFELLLDQGEPDGYLRDWRAPGLAPERHIVYAGQWWLFAAGAAAASVALLWRLRRRKQ
jgi:surfeit locus 1 family protein